MFAEKSRTLSTLINMMKRALDDAEKLAELVATFNALALPKSYVCIVNGLVHVVIINLAEPIFNDPRTHVLARAGMGIEHGADVIWRFDPRDGRWQTLKDRTGTYRNIVRALSPVRSGGFSDGATFSQTMVL